MKLPVGYVPGVGVVKATAYGGYGQRMLEKMGWEKGDGLGKQKDGMKSAIEAKEKKDTSGVGAGAQGWDWKHRFWEDAYNSASKKINHDLYDSDSSSSSSSSSSGSSSSGSSSSDIDDEEVSTPLGQKVMNRDGTVASATAEELKLAAALAKDPWGRFGGRSGKMARIRMQEELEAQKAREALGVASGPSVAEDSKPAAPKAEEEKPKRRGIVVTLKIKDDPNFKREKFVPTPATGWWGTAYFKSAGAMGDNDDEEEGNEEDGESSGRKRKSFNEDDQAALYMKVHDAQRQGRRGLGKSTTLKIEGGKWEGSKKTFEEDEEAPKEDKKAKKMRKDEDMAEPASNGSPPKIKWLKVVKELLMQAPKRHLKMEKLCKKMMKHQKNHHRKHHHKNGLKKVKSQDKIQEIVMKKVSSCGKLFVCDKGVVSFKSD